MTSSSFSHLLEAPVEGIIVSLPLPTGQTVKKYFAKSHLGTKILLEMSSGPNLFCRGSVTEGLSNLGKV